MEDIRLTDELNSLSPEEELKKFFRENDPTVGMMLGHVPDVHGGQAVWYQKAKKQFSQYWQKKLPALGVNRPMKNYSKNHPVNLLEDADGTRVGERVAEIAADEKAWAESLDLFFTMYEQPLEAGLAAYAQSIGKAPDDLTDDEIRFALDKICDVINEELIRATMIGQQVPEMFGVTKKTAAYEDYSPAVHNPDRINFEKQWTHSDTKLGAPLSLEALEETAKGRDRVERGRGFFDVPGSTSSAQTDARYEDLRRRFLEMLDGTDREIFLLTEQGCTQAEIAARLGYKTHSAVTKRKEKMKERFLAFVKEEKK